MGQHVIQTATSFDMGVNPSAESRKRLLPMDAKIDIGERGQPFPELGDVSVKWLFDDGREIIGLVNAASILKLQINITYVAYTREGEKIILHIISHNQGMWGSDAKEMQYTMTGSDIPNVVRVIRKIQ